MVGIDFNLSHHIARKNFASTVLLYNDVPMEVVSKLLGHSSMKITQDSYGKLLQEHLTNKLVYHDTLEGYLNIPQRNYSFRLSYSTYENLKSQGFDIISNEELRLDIIKLYNEHFGLFKKQEGKLSDINQPTCIKTIFAI